MPCLSWPVLLGVCSHAGLTLLARHLFRVEQSGGSGRRSSRGPPDSPLYSDEFAPPPAPEFLTTHYNMLFQPIRELTSCYSSCPAAQDRVLRRGATERLADSHRVV